MSRPSPFIMTIGEDGLSVRCELDVHYLTDEQMEAILEYVETLQDENDMLLKAYLSERKLMMDYAKLKVVFNETLARLIAANEETEANYMDEDYCNLLRELGVEMQELFLHSS